MSTNALGIFADTFSRPSLEANLDAVAEHGLAVVHYDMSCAGLPSLPEYIAPELARRIGAAASERRRQRH